MEKRIRFLLLKLLNENGDITNLEKSGYKYSEIASAYSQLINEKLVQPNEKLQFELSEIGFLELERLNHEINKNGEWKIEPFVKYKIEKKDIYDIFIE